MSKSKRNLNSDQIDLRFFGALYIIVAVTLSFFLAAVIYHSSNIATIGLLVWLVAIIPLMKYGNYLIEKRWRITI